MIEIWNVLKFYGWMIVLYDVLLVLFKGGVIVLIGLNGVGKFMLLLIMVWLVVFDMGSVSVDGMDVIMMFSGDLVCKLVILWQENYFVVCLIVCELVVFGCFLYFKGWLSEFDCVVIQCVLDYLDFGLLVECFIDQLLGG